MDQKEQAALAASLKLEIDAFDHDAGDSETASERYDALMDRYETALAYSWVEDGHGLMTGGVEWAAANVKEGERVLIHQDLEEGMLFGETQRQISVLHYVGTNGLARFVVEYQREQGHYVEIDQFGANVRTSSLAAPYEVYRPYVEGGQRRYALTRRVVVERHVLPGAPVYLSQLLEEAQVFVESSLYCASKGEILSGEIDFTPADYDLVECQYTEVSSDMLSWLEEVRLAVADFGTERDVEEFLELLESFYSSMEQLIVDLGDQFRPIDANEDDVEEKLRDIDSREDAHEVSMF